MSEVTLTPPEKASATGDPFVTQVNWLVAAVGGKDQLVQRCSGLVSARTLDNWTAGNYPRAKVTGAVRELDAWALEHVPGYPEAAGVPRLVESSGPHRLFPRAGTGRNPDGAGPASSTATGAPPVGSHRRPWLRWSLASVVLVAVAACSSLITLLIARQPATPDPVAAARSIAREPLPSTGDGKEYAEQTGHIGANTFADPRTLLDGSQKIPPSTTVQVRCRYYAPSVPSVTPDGFWYLIDSDRWSGRWSPANSFMNGDVPGGPSLHNTDFAVPVCK